MSRLLRSSRHRRAIGAGAAVALALVVGGLLLWLWPRWAPGTQLPAPDAAAGRRTERERLPAPASEPVVPSVPAQPSPTPAEIPAPAGTPLPCAADECLYEMALPTARGTTLRLIDDSDVLDWTRPDDACRDDLAAFLDKEGLAFEAIDLTLRNELTDVGTPLQFQFPPSDDPAAQPAPNEAAAQCALYAHQPTWTHCRVAVTRHSGLPNNDQRLASMAAFLDALRRVHYEKAEDLASFYHPLDDLTLFEPVIRERDGTWTTRCWNVAEQVPFRP